jgi:phage gp45-like
MSSAIERLSGRLLSLCGFGRILTTTALGGKALRRAQVRIDDAEIRDETPMVAHYGIASRPLPGAQAVMVFPFGDRSKGLIIATNDARYQIELQEGEVAIHTDEGDHVHLKRGRVISIKAGTRLEIDTPLIKTTGRIEAAGDVVAGAISLQKHVHGGVRGGDSQTSGPVA